MSFAALFAPLVVTAVACSFSFAAGCSPAHTNRARPAESAVTGNLPCEVSEVLAKNCGACHGTEPVGAPMSLVSLADLRAPSPSDPAVPVYQSVAARIHARKGQMPQGKPALGAKEMKALDDWITGGAEGVAGPSCAGSVVTTEEALACDSAAGEVLQRIEASAPLPVDATVDVPDRYACIGFDLPFDGEKRHITKLYPHLDQHKYLHHILLYRLAEKDARALPNAPFVCPGAPGGDGRDTSNWRLVTGWEPGGGITKLPPVAGFSEEPFTGDRDRSVTHWVLEIHYSNPKAEPGVKDQTGYDLCATKKLRKYDADVMRFGTEHFAIPAHQGKTVACAWRVPHLTDFAKPNVEGLHVFSATAHMHDFGREIFTVAAGGAILANTNFDYKNQSAVDADIVLKAGDDTWSVCRWENTSDRRITYGEVTGASEMCYVYASYYPKIEDPSWNWNAPAASVAGDSDPRCKDWQLPH
jgi:hypothetical protein